MRGGGDDVRVLKGLLEKLRGDQATRVCHVSHQVGTSLGAACGGINKANMSAARSYLVGNVAKALVVPVTGVGGATADEQLGAKVERPLLKGVVVHIARLIDYD